MRDALPAHLRAEIGIAVDEVGRDFPGRDDLARAVDVGEKHVQRLDALVQTGLEFRPFGPADHPRDDVEGDQPLGRVLVAVDGEGDADAPEQEFGLRAAGFEQGGGRVRKPSGDPLIDVPNGAVGQGHLIETLHARLGSPLSERLASNVPEGSAESAANLHRAEQHASPAGLPTESIRVPLDLSTGAWCSRPIIGALHGGSS